MGLLDVLNGMQNGPRGPSTPSSQSSSSSGMSPMTMAILGLLAWKTFKHLTAGQPGATPQPSPTPTHLPPPVNAGAGGGVGGALAGGGGLGDLLKGGLGGLLAGGAAGSVLSGGLGDLLNQLQQGGHGEAANTWVGKGENKAISPGDLANALGADQIQSLSAQSGLSRDELLSGLSQYLPQVIDHLTPDGRLPTENEVSGRI
ncbi:YidB family protein [Bradyrhizobium monzae]|uniref:YidB family protein n=1 Tax=Bradyrhizobium sp. Oc8 TaxID=2876780 RepID=UPI001F2326E0|nr:YidB family protein [Bradyrhizobium sp. Oc8]